MPGASSIRSRAIQNQALLRDLSGRVHLGEAAAITLTAELDEALLIIDDAAGRRIAVAMGLRCTGTVGVLVAGKQAGHVARIAPLLEDLRLRARFWISDDVVARARDIAGE